MMKLWMDGLEWMKSFNKSALNLTEKAFNNWT